MRKIIGQWSVRQFFVTLDIQDLRLKVSDMSTSPLHATNVLLNPAFSLVKQYNANQNEHNLFTFLFSSNLAMVDCFLIYCQYFGTVRLKII